MQPIAFRVPTLPTPRFVEHLRAFWARGERRLYPAASAAQDAWLRMAEAHRDLCRAAQALEEQSLTLKESAQACAEASLALRYGAHLLGEVEFLDEIAADTLAEATPRILRSRPPEALAGIHARFCAREQVFQADREAHEAAYLAWRAARVELHRARTSFHRRWTALIRGLEGPREPELLGRAA